MGVDKAKEEFLKKLLLAFKAEGEERLKSMSSELLELENTSIPEKQTEIIETIFRQVHSLKGAARAVKITNVEIICQTLENVLAALKNKERTLSSELFDIFYDTIDIINKLLSSPEESNSIQISELLEKLTSLEPAKHKNKTPSKDHLRDNSKTTLLKPPPEHPSKENKPEKREPQISAATKLKITKPVIQDDQLIKKKSVLAKSVRLATAKLDTLFLQAEQMLALKSMISQRIIELRNAKEILDLYKKQGGETYQQISKIKQLPPEIKKESNIQVQVSNPSTKLTILPRCNHTPLKLLQNKLMALVKSSEQDYRLTSAMIDNHLEDMKKILMLPFSSLLEIFPRMVRDLSRSKSA